MQFSNVFPELKLVNVINNQASQTTHYLHERRSQKAFRPFSKKDFRLKIFQNFLECRKIFPVNQFDGLLQQNKRKTPAEMYLFNLNYKSVTITHTNLGIKWVERLSF